MNDVCVSLSLCVCVCIHIHIQTITSLNYTNVPQIQWIVT